jgi:hypothetical protein
VSLSSPEHALALLPGRAVLRAGGGPREQAAGEGWDGALAGLRALLDKAHPRGAIHVVMSHHFSRLLLLAPPPLRLNGAEMEGWIDGRLSELYGVEAAAWRAVWQDPPPGRPIPVAVMEAARFDGLLELLREAGLRPGRVEPWFAAAWNRHRRAMAGRSGWFALLEPGRIALARVEGRRPITLRVAQGGAEPMQDLSALLTRESLHGGVTRQGDLWLAAAGVQAPVSGDLAGCAIRPLLHAGAGVEALLA